MMRSSARLLAPLALLGLLGTGGTTARAQVFGGGPPIPNIRNYTSAFLGGGEVSNDFYGVGELLDGPAVKTDYLYTTSWTGDGASLGQGSDTISGQITGSAKSSFHQLGASMQVSLANPFFVANSAGDYPHLSPPRYYNAFVGAHWEDKVKVFATGFSGGGYLMTFKFAIEGTENSVGYQDTPLGRALINFRYGIYPTDVLATEDTSLQIFSFSHLVTIAAETLIENTLYADWTIDMANPDWEVRDGDGNLLGYAPGHDVSAVVNFGSTMTLTGVELADPNGNPIRDFDLVSANGVLFRGGVGAAADVPEPGTLALAGAGLLPILGIVRRRARR